MDIDTYNRWEKMLKLREELLAVEEDRMTGSFTNYKIILEIVTFRGGDFFMPQKKC